MRKYALVVARVAMSLALAAGVSGCGSSQTPTKAAAGGQSSSSTLVFASNQEPASLNVISMLSVNAGEIDAQIFDNLDYLNKAMAPVPGLATSWTSTPNAETWTLTLKQGVQFSNGKPFNATTVQQYFNLLMHPVKGLVLGGTPSQIQPYLAGVKVLGPYKVQILLKKPLPDFMVLMTSPNMGIPYPPAVAANPTGFGQKPIGSGPYVFTSWIHGSKITLTANPKYRWGSKAYFGTTGPAKIKTLVFRFIPNAVSRLDALRSGQVQFVDLLPFAEVKSVRRSTEFKVAGYIIPGMPQMNYMNISVAPTNDINVRKAIEYAVNKNAIIKDVYFGMTIPAYGPLSEAFKGAYDPALRKLYPFNPKKAEQILSADGWKLGAGGVRYKNGKPLAVQIVENVGWNDWVYLMQSELNSVGFKASVVSTEGASNTAALASCKYSMPAMGDVFSTPTVMSEDWLWTPKNHAAFAGICGEDPKLNAMLTQATSQVNLAKQNQELKTIQMYIMQKAYEVPIFELEFYTAYAKNLKGFVVDGTGYYKYFLGAKY